MRESADPERLHLSGKVGVVTGASRGIGLAITQALAAWDSDAFLPGWDCVSSAG